jgi:quinol monooxygenase YgiN
MSELREQIAVEGSIYHSRESQRRYEMVTFIGVGHIKPGKMDQALDAVHAFMQKIRTEPGTLEYIVYRGGEDRNTLFFYEKYQDQDAQTAHWATEEMKAFQEAFMPCIDGQPIMGVVEEVASAR